MFRELVLSANKAWMFVAYLGNFGMNEIENALQAACDRKLDLELTPVNSVRFH
ncbi:MAG: hypothetical protein NVS1B11_17800 [Terriglobales bacterium]